MITGKKRSSGSTFWCNRSRVSCCLWSYYFYWGWNRERRGCGPLGLVERTSSRVSKQEDWQPREVWVKRPWGQGCGECHNLLEQNQEVTRLSLFVVEVILKGLWEKILVLGSSRTEPDKDCVSRAGRSWGMSSGRALSSIQSCQWIEVTLHQKSWPS